VDQLSFSTKKGSIFALTPTSALYRNGVSPSAFAMDVCAGYGLTLAVYRGVPYLAASSLACARQ
jgi:hypothetical protein